MLIGIAAEKTYAQIAKDLGVAYDTVKVYANRLRAKTGASSKVGLALYYEKTKEAV